MAAFGGSFLALLRARKPQKLKALSGVKRVEKKPEAL